MREQIIKTQFQSNTSFTEKKMGTTASIPNTINVDEIISKTGKWKSSDKQKKHLPITLSNSSTVDYL